MLPYLRGAAGSKSLPQPLQTTEPIMSLSFGLLQKGQRSPTVRHFGSAAWHCGQSSTCSPLRTNLAQGDFPLTGSVWTLPHR